jgi:hypothetical protein
VSARAARRLGPCLLLGVAVALAGEAARSPGQLADSAELLALGLVVLALALPRVVRRARVSPPAARPARRSQWRGGGVPHTAQAGPRPSFSILEYSVRRPIPSERAAADRLPRHSRSA